MNVWIVNQYDNDLILFSVKNNIHLMQYQYGSQQNRVVTLNWRRVQMIKDGDWLVLYNRNKAFAIGKAICSSVRHNTVQISNVTNTIDNKSHKYTSGLVIYDDAEVFYENLSDPPPGKDEPWGQRLDVEEWLYFTGLDNAVSTDGVSSHRRVGTPVDTVFGIDEGFFDNIKINLINKSLVIIEKRKVRFEMSLTGKLIQLMDEFSNIVLQGPPGTSKTFQAKMLAAAIALGITDEDKLQEAISGEINPDSDFRKTSFPNNENFGYGTWAIVQFHPSYNYEDFVRGIQVTTEGNNPMYSTVNRMLIEMADAAQKENGKLNKRKYVLIIDEINRAHLAAVLGELIYALEYRGCPINTPYEIEDQSKKTKSRSITIPDNLYIIGTMNTADRSVGHIDYAVRRRFAFVPLLPDIDIIDKDNANGRALYNEVAKLFHKNGDKNDGRASTLSPEFYPDDIQPGHTYFLKKDSKKLAMVFAYQVFPLLREYYKDGILTKDAKLFDGEIKIDKPNEPQKIIDVVEKFLKDKIV